jgi:glycosyltransferase involved in cell wall biosynthesis
MQNRAVVSVIVTVFGRSQYLESALESVVSQTYKNLEIIVTDDSNSQVIRDICFRFASDRRLRYRANSRAFGASKNIAAALNEARGEFVTILNDDDVLESFMIEHLLSPLVANERCILSFADHWMITSDGELALELTERNSHVRGRSKLQTGIIESPVSLALRGAISVVMGALIRRSALQPEWFIQEVEGAYDYWLAVNLAFTGSFFFVMERVMRYRVHSASESGKLYSDKAIGEVFVYNRLLRHDLQLRDRVFIKRQLEHHLFVLGRDRLYFGKNSLARDAFRHALRSSFSLRAIIGLILTFLPVALQRWLLRNWRSARGISTALPNS